MGTIKPLHTDPHPRALLERRGEGGRGSKGEDPSPPAEMKIKATPCPHPPLRILDNPSRPANSLASEFPG